MRMETMAEEFCMKSDNHTWQGLTKKSWTKNWIISQSDRNQQHRSTRCNMSLAGLQAKISWHLLTGWSRQRITRRRMLTGYLISTWAMTTWNKWMTIHMIYRKTVTHTQSSLSIRKGLSLIWIESIRHKCQFMKIAGANVLITVKRIFKMSKEKGWRAPRWKWSRQWHSRLHCQDTTISYTTMQSRSSQIQLG